MKGHGTLTARTLNTKLGKVDLIMSVPIIKDTLLLYA